MCEIFIVRCLSCRFLGWSRTVLQCWKEIICLWVVVRTTRTRLDTASTKVMYMKFMPAKSASASVTSTLYLSSFSNRTCYCIAKLAKTMVLCWNKIIWAWNKVILAWNNFRAIERVGNYVTCWVRMADITTSWLVKLVGIDRSFFKSSV